VHTKDVKQLAIDFSEHVDVVTIYIVEAHPSDEWALNDGLDDGAACVRQPRTLTQRNDACKAFAERFEFPTENLLVDSMDNELNEAYAAEPERLFVIADGKLAYVGGFGPYHYDVAEVRQFLTDALGTPRLP